MSLVRCSSVKIEEFEDDVSTLGDIFANFNIKDVLDLNTYTKHSTPMYGTSPTVINHHHHLNVLVINNNNNVDHMIDALPRKSCSCKKLLCSNKRCGCLKTKQSCDDTCGCGIECRNIYGKN